MNSKFSDFFRLATYEEKERVWKEIARKSCEDQQEIINKANQMSALNEKKEKTLTTPSVIFKLLRFPVFLGCCYVIHFYFDDNILLYFVGAVILL